MKKSRNVLCGCIVTYLLLPDNCFLVQTTLKYFPELTLHLHLQD